MESKSLKAEELMIGDWVSMSLCPDITNLYFASRINEGNLVSLQRQFVFDAKPIPLTAEILELNGYEKLIDSTIAYTMNLVKCDLHIWIQFMNNGTPFLGLTKSGAGSKEIHMHINSVHELQHILRICGLHELDNNFKVN